MDRQKFDQLLAEHDGAVNRLMALDKFIRRPWYQRLPEYVEAFAHLWRHRWMVGQDNVITCVYCGDCKPSA